MNEQDEGNGGVGEWIWYTSYVPGKFKYRCQELLGWHERNPWLPVRVRDTAEIRTLVEEIMAFTTGNPASVFSGNPVASSVVDSSKPVIVSTHDEALERLREAIDESEGIDQLVEFDDCFAAEIFPREHTIGGYYVLLLDKRDGGLVSRRSGSEFDNAMKQAIATHRFRA